MISITLSRAAPSAWILRSIGLDKSRLKIPMIDLASITYLPDTRSKSQSNLLISFTNAFTFLLDLNHFCCTIFVAKHPVTKPNLNVIRKSEEKLAEKIDELMEAALSTAEVIEIQ